MRGGSYLELPKELRNSKKGLINLKNDDNKCFLWCHVRNLNPQEKNPQRIKNEDKEFAKKLDYSGINFPLQYNDYNKIEKKNQININVFGYISFIYPIHIPEEKFKDHLEILLINKCEKSHYVLIENFNRLMFPFPNHKDTKHFCMRCLHCFSSELLLEKHSPDCFSLNGTQKIELPKPGTKVFFKNYHRKQPVPFVIYADFEALTKKIDTCHQNNDKSFTDPYQEHQPCGYGYKVVCHQDQSYSRPFQYYRGKDVIEEFNKKMTEEVKNCQKVMKKHFNKKLIMNSALVAVVIVLYLPVSSIIIFIIVVTVFCFFLACPY